MRNRVIVVLSLAGCLIVGAAVPAQAALRPMKEKGNGEAEPVKCPDFICFNFTADAKGKPINEGTFKGTLRAPNGENYVNNDGHFCRPADGTGVFRKGSDRIKVAWDGEACSTKIKGHLRVRAYATITGGEGDFNNAKGAGGITFNWIFLEGTHPISYSWDGTIKGNAGAG